MKQTKKILALALTAITLSMGIVQFSGCKRENFEETIDENKTQLIVSNYDGGFGTAWLEDIKERFETAYAETVYEPGKKGVQILLDPNKVEGDAFAWSNTDAQVAFTEKMSTNKLMQMASLGQLLDVTDVLDTILAQDGVSLPENVVGALKILDGKTIYQIPHYEGGGGIVYDKDLFEEYRLYKSKTGGWTNREEGNLSVGSDGKEGTMDDGLPVTYKEFFQLCTRMKQNTIIPFIISGEWKYSYQDLLLEKATLAYDGVQTTEAFLHFNGDTANYVTNITDNADAYFGYDLTMESASITPENGYLRDQTPGRLYAFEMLNKIVTDKLYSVSGWSSSVSHLDAQDKYLRSTKNNEPIAMLIDGTWWENEANPVFESMGNLNSSYKKENRNFGWMSLPTKVDENDTNANNDGLATIDHLNACAIARADVSENIAKLAKDFLKFCYTPAELEAFTVKTGTTRVFNYKISDESYNQLTSYQKDIWQIHKQGSFIYKNSSSTFYAQNYTKLYSEKWTSPEYRGALVTFATKDNTVTAKQFFMSFWTDKETWNSTVTK